jgi:hypothetical protein
MRKRPRPKLRAPESIETVIERAGEDRFARNRPVVGERVWRDAVGLRIAERARPLSLERGVLTLLVATSTWASELTFLAPTILERLRAAKVSVNELRFRVGHVEPPARPPERRTSRAVPRPAPIPPDLANALSKVDDLELREAIAGAASANLAWRAYNEPPPPADTSVRARPATAHVNEEPRDAPAPRSSETESDRRGRR